MGGRHGQRADAAGPVDYSDRRRIFADDGVHEMPLSIIAPGKRKGNKFYIFRGRVAGKLREVATKLGPETPARNVRKACGEAEREIWAEHEASRVPRSGEDATFAQAAKQYLNFKDPDAKRQQLRQRIDKLLPHLGDRTLASI